MSSATVYRYWPGASTIVCLRPNIESKPYPPHLEIRGSSVMTVEQLFQPRDMLREC